MGLIALFVVRVFFVDFSSSDLYFVLRIPFSRAKNSSEID